MSDAYDSMKWKTLSSEYVYTDEWLKARKEKCIRPDGRIVEPYYILDYATWVAAVALTTDNQVVLIRQYRHALGEVCLEIPGGCVDEKDESLESAVLRELAEETGYVFSEVHHLGFCSPNPSANSNLMQLFLLKGGVKTMEQSLDHNEDIQVELYPLDELFQLVLDRKIHTGMHISGVILALHHLGKIAIR